MSLGTGEAILFSPNGLAARIQKADYQRSNRLVPTRIGQGYLIVRSRLRVTRDGGHSILAVHNPALSSPLSRPSGDADEPTAPPVVRLPSSISSHPGSVNAHCSHPYIDDISDADNTPDSDRSQAAETVEERSSSLRVPSRLPALFKQKWKAVDEQCERPSSVREEQTSVDEQIAIALQHVDEEAEQTAGHDTWRGDISSELHRATLVSPSLASATLSPPIPANTSAFTGPVTDTGRVSASTGHPVLSELHSHLVRIVTRERVCDWTELWWLQKKYKDEFGKQNLRRFIQGCVDDGLVRRVDDTHIALPDTSRQVISDAFSGPSHTPALPLAAEPSNVGTAFSQREPVVPVGPEPLAVAGNDNPSIGGSAPEPRPAQASVSDSDVKSLVVLLQTHAAEGFPELGIHYVMGQTRGYGVSGSSMEARMKVAIARAEALGIIGVRHTALGEWLYLPGAILDNIPTSHTYSAASDSASASSTSCERHEPAPTPAKAAESANVAAKGKETTNAGAGTSPGADSATSRTIAMTLAEESLALLNVSRVASGSAAPAHTSHVQAAVKPEPEGDGGSDDDSDDDRAAPQYTSAVASEGDIASLVAFCRSQHEAGHAQLGLTYVRTWLPRVGKVTWLPRTDKSARKKMWKIGRLRATVAAAASRGLIGVYSNQLGEWVLAPGTAPRVFAEPFTLEAGAPPLAAPLRTSTKPASCSRLRPAPRTVA
jgi:hypothetical protein